MIKKFIKATGLHNVFNVSDSDLDITSIKEEMQSEINQNSILFLTASEDSLYGYPDGTKYIWIMNSLYPIMPNRIFESKSELDTFVTTSKAIPGLILNVTNDTVSSNNGAYLVEKNGASELKLSKIVTGELDISGYMIEIYKKDNKYYYIDPISGEEIEVYDSYVDEEGKYLLLTLGEDKVFINSKDLINLENYYTKDEIDSSINNINSSISDISSHIATSLKSTWISSNTALNNSTLISVSSEKTNGVISNTSIKVSGNNYIKLEGSSNNITLSVDTATLADASNGSTGLAIAQDAYKELVDVEEVVATSVTTMANTLGLNSSLNVDWSTTSGIPAETDYKTAIENTIENIQDNYYTKEEIDASVNIINSSILNINSSIQNISINSLNDSLIVNNSSISFSSDTSYIHLAASDNKLLINSSIITLADASNDSTGLATAEDVYTELTNVEEVMATSVTTMANTLGLNSSLNVDWSAESGIQEGTDFKTAIEMIIQRINALS